jgi:hypothetical protein
MQKDATSIYEDRLMPSTFLFDIREALYQERLILSSGAMPAAIAKQLAAHRSSIAGLVGRYEKTVLTPEEQKKWETLKMNLHAFHSANALTPESRFQFEEAVSNINKLKAIQAGEGAYLQKELSRIGSASSLRAYLEIVLLIVIGVITLSLIGFSRNVFEQTITHRPSLN